VSPPAPKTPQGERQQGGNLAGDAGLAQDRLVETGKPGVTPARLAVRQVTREPPSLLGTERGAHRCRARGGDDRLDALAALAADELVIFHSEALARAKQRALHDRSRHPEALADLVVRESLELAHHQDLVVVLR
jgi:hypothetical protein